MMNIAGIRIRYINYACYEIVLPNGKEILIDPAIDFKGETTAFTRDDYRGADYILLSHTHYDHTQDLAYVAQKFHSKVFIGQMSLYSEARYCDLNLDMVYPVAPGDRFELEDFTLEVFRGKHTFLNNPDGTIKKMEEGLRDFPKEHAIADIWGSMEYMDYMITTKQNLRIFINGGGAYHQFYTNAYDTVKKYAPNIIFRQSTSKYTSEEFAKVMNDLHPQLVIPLHQDGIVRKTGKSVGEYVDEVNKELEKIGSITRMVDPKRFKWFEISMQVKEL